MKQDNYKPLGNYIQLVDKRNRDGAISNLVGVSFEKKIIPSIANTIGTDLSNYRIIKPGQFAYCPVTSRNGERISIALYKSEETAILSVAYSVFEIIKPEELDADYLMLWVSRPEFDRYARFMSHGSVRELFSWEEMCNVLLPVPPIEEQRRIVSEYQTVERRIKNNEAMIQKLEETAQAIYHHTFVEGIDENNLPEGWRMGCLGDIANICSGKDHKDLHDGEIPIYGSGGLMRKGNDYLYEGESVLIPRKGTLNNIMYVNEAFWTVDTLFYTTMKIDNVALYLYYSIKDIDFLAQDSGTSVPSNTSKELNMTKLLIPTKDVLKEYDCQCQTIHCYIDSLTKETSHLRTLLSLLTSKLS